MMSFQLSNVYMIITECVVGYDLCVFESTAGGKIEETDFYFIVGIKDGTCV